MARRRSRSAELDPFVVLSDATIALSFIMLVYALFAGLAATKSVIEANRRDRQSTVREAIYAEWLKFVPDLVQTPSGTDRTVWSYTSQGRSIARIDENASFQRIGVYKPYYARPTSVVPTFEDQPFLDAAIRISGRNWSQLSYIQIHGLSSSPGESGVQVSQARAEERVRHWQSLGSIQRYGDHERAPKATPPDIVPIRNVNAYGTGDLIYASPLADRVDVVLFYNDRGTK